MFLDISGKNLQDEDVVKVLEGHFGTDLNRTILFDLTFNRLTLGGLKMIIDFMEPRINMRACVGENSFHFIPFFKTMQERGVDSWIDSDRLTLGRSPISKDTDRLAADCLRKSDGLKALEQFNLEMHRRQDERWAREDERRAKYAKEDDERRERYAKEADVRKKELDKMNRETTRKFDQFYGTEKNRTKQIEEEVEDALRVYCIGINKSDEESMDFDVVVLDKKCHKIFDENHQIIVEWDGFVSMRLKEENILFLVEAKSYAKPLDVDDIKKRVDKTMKYIQTKADSLKNSRNNKAEACIFAGLKDHEIKVAIGGPSITESMRNIILANGYYLVRMENSEYTVTPPEL
jgi:hypothetical protein